jgi:hypothetical protein
MSFGLFQHAAVAIVLVLIPSLSTGRLGQLQTESELVAADERSMVVNAVWSQFQRLDHSLLKRPIEGQPKTSGDQSTDEGNVPALAGDWLETRFEHLQALIPIVTDPNDLSIAQQVMASGLTVVEQQELRSSLAIRLAELGRYDLSVQQLRAVPSSCHKVSAINQICRIAGDFGSDAVAVCQVLIREQMPQAGDVLPTAVSAGLGGDPEPAEPLTVADTDLLREQAWTQLAISLAKSGQPALDKVLAELQNPANQDVVELERAIQAHLRRPLADQTPDSLAASLEKTPFQSNAARNLAALVLVDECFRRQSFTNLEWTFDHGTPSGRDLLRKAILDKIQVLQRQEPEMARRFAARLFDELVISPESDGDEAPEMFWSSPEEEMVFIAGYGSAIDDSWRRTGQDETLSLERILKAMIITRVCQNGLEVLNPIEAPSKRKGWIEASLYALDSKLTESEIRQVAAAFQDEFGTPLVADLEDWIFHNAIRRGDFLLAWNQFERQGGMEKRTSWAKLLVLLDLSPERKEAVAGLRAVLVDHCRAEMAEMSDAQAIDFLNLQNLNLSVRLGRKVDFPISQHPYRDLLWEKAVGMEDIATAYRRLTSILFSMTTFVDPQSPIMYRELIDAFVQERSPELNDAKLAQLLKLTWLLDKHHSQMPLRGWSEINAETVPKSLAELTEEFPMVDDWSTNLSSLKPAEIKAFRFRPHTITRLLALKHVEAGDIRRTLKFMDALPMEGENFELLLEVATLLLSPKAVRLAD